MAIPPVESTTTVVGSGSLATLTMPDPRPDDDLYVAFIHTDNSRVFSSDYPGVQPSGSWTTISTASGGVGGCSLGAWYKIGSSEPEQYAWEINSSTEYVGGVIQVSDIDTVTPIDTYSSFDTAFSSSPTVSVLTSTVNDTLVLYVCSLDADDITGVPAGTEQLYRNDDGSGDIYAAASWGSGPASGSASTATTFSVSASDDWATAAIAIKPAIAITESTLQDSFTFTDQGLAEYSNVNTVTDGTPGFQNGIDYSTQNASGVITAQLADSFTNLGKLVRDLVVSRNITDSSTFTEGMSSELTYPLWARVVDLIKESWSRKTDSNRESWSRATDTNRETY